MSRVHDAGFDPSVDDLVLLAPDDPAVGENHGFWFFEDGGAFTFHVHLEANSPMWSLRRELVEVMLADGRVMSDWQYGLGTNEKGPGSACTRTAAITPFAHWSLDYRGLPHLSCGEDMARLIIDLECAERLPVELNLDLHMAAAPWVQGALTPGGMGADATAAIGGFRHEQLFRATGEVRVGNERRAVTGTGLRTHRIGPRSMASFAGHSWQTVLFPSGRGFGFQRHYLPDGTISFDEGFILEEDGSLAPVTVIEVPPMLNRFSGQKVRTVLGHAGKEIVVEGETVAIHHWTRAHADKRNRLQFGAGLFHAQNFILNNGCVRAVWDGEVGYGLLERSSVAAKLS